LWQQKTIIVKKFILLSSPHTLLLLPTPFSSPHPSSSSSSPPFPSPHEEKIRLAINFCFVGGRGKTTACHWTPMWISKKPTPKSVFCRQLQWSSQTGKVWNMTNQVPQLSTASASQKKEHFPFFLLNYRIILNLLCFIFFLFFSFLFLQKVNFHGNASE
jgi:hypothetical protein